ncbi:hypothetical protein BGZ76_008261, partial [Entomortierella beljakovae]
DTLEHDEAIPLCLDKYSSNDDKSSSSASRNPNSEENSLSGQISLILRDPIWIEEGWELTSVLEMEIDGNDSDIDDDDNSTPDSDNTCTG